MLETIATLRTTVNKAHGKLAHHEAEATKAQTLMAVSTALLHAREKAVAIVQATAKETQDQLKFRIESIVQEALDAVFPGYVFKVDYETKRDRTEASIYLEQDGEKFHPLEDNGGGLADVLAFALRLVAWSLGKTDNVLILDEPAKAVSRSYRPMMMEMLSGLSSQLGLQTIIVTHDAEIVDMADRIFKVTKGPDGRAKVVVK